MLLSCVVDGEGVATHVLPCSCPIIYHGRCADAGLWARRPSSPMPGSSTSGGQAPVEFEQYIHLTHIAGCFVWSSVAPSRNGVKSFMAGPVWKSIWLRRRTANFILLLTKGGKHRARDAAWNSLRKRVHDTNHRRKRELHGINSSRAWTRKSMGPRMIFFTCVWLGIFLG